MMEDVQFENAWGDFETIRPRRLSLVEIADIQYIRMKSGLRLPRPRTDLDLSPREREWLNESRSPRNNCDA